MPHPNPNSTPLLGQLRGTGASEHCHRDRSAVLACAVPSASGPVESLSAGDSGRYTSGSVKMHPRGTHLAASIVDKPLMAWALTLQADSASRRFPFNTTLGSFGSNTLSNSLLCPYRTTGAIIQHS